MRESRFTQVAKPTYHIAKQALPTYCIAVFCCCARLVCAEGFERRAPVVRLGIIAT
jgi:hypothetical protein